MFLLLMPSLPIKLATVNYCNYERELSALHPPTHTHPQPTPPTTVCGDATGAIVLLQLRLVSAPLKPWQGSGCEGGLGTHDRVDARETALFILDNWESK